MNQATQRFDTPHERVLARYNRYDDMENPFIGTTLLPAVPAFDSEDGYKPLLYVVTGGPRSGKSWLAKNLAKTTGSICVDIDEFLPLDSIYGISADNIVITRAQQATDVRRHLLDSKPVVACADFSKIESLQAYCDMRYKAIIYCFIAPRDSSDMSHEMPWSHMISKSTYPCGDQVMRDVTVMQISALSIAAQIQSMRSKNNDMINTIQNLNHAMQIGAL